VFSLTAREPGVAVAVGNEGLAGRGVVDFGGTAGGFFPSGRVTRGVGLGEDDFFVADSRPGGVEALTFLLGSFFFPALVDFTFAVELWSAMPPSLASAEGEANFGTVRAEASGCASLRPGLPLELPQFGQTASSESSRVLQVLHCMVSLPLVRNEHRPAERSALLASTVHRPVGSGS
jgi:hypothetical protein